MTPIASVIRGVTTLNRTDGESDPRSSGVTLILSMMTEVTIMAMPTRASPEARESLWISR